MNACRFCKEDYKPLLKYGVRHYAHADCGAAKFGFKEFIDKLPTHIIKSLPFRLCKANGYDLSDMDKYVAQREKAAG